MKISCDKCGAHYEVDESRIPPAGLTMKCPRCMASLTVKRGEGAPAIDLGWEVNVGESSAAPPASAPRIAAPPHAPQGFAPPPTGGQRYHIRRRTGKVFGPFVEKAIASMLEQHQLEGDEELSLDGQTWMPIAQVQGLAHLARSSSGTRIPSHSQPNFQEEESDLPAPKGYQEVIDLPGLPGQAAVPPVLGTERDFDLADLPAPKGSSLDLQDFDLPAGNDLGELDLSAPEEISDLLAPKGAPAPPPNRAPKTGIEFGQVDFGEELDLSDLPAPKEMEISDLPTPKVTDLTDLLAPKLPAQPSPGFPDLPAPPLIQNRPASKSSPAEIDLIENLPAPKRNAPLKATPTDDAGLLDLDDLPLPPGAPAEDDLLIDFDLPMPKRASAEQAADLDAASIVDVVRPKETGDQPAISFPLPVRDSNAMATPVPVAPPAHIAPAAPLAHIASAAPAAPSVPNPPTDGEAQAASALKETPREKKAREKKAKEKTPKEKKAREKKAKEKTPKEKKAPAPGDRRRRLIVTAGSVGGVIILAGIALGLATDYGFFGIGLITGDYARADQARGHLASGSAALLEDTFRGYRQAATEFELAGGKTPDAPEPRALQIQALAAQMVRFGPDPAARTQAEAALARLAEAEASPSLAKAKGMLALARGQQQEALTSLKAISEQEPGDAQAAVYLGWVHLAQRDHRAAISVFSRALAANARHAAASYGQAQAHLQLKEIPQARAAITRTLSLSPGHPSALMLQAQLELDAGETKPVQALLLQVLGAGDRAAPRESSQAQTLIGELTLRQGQNAAARTRFENALKINPQNARALLGLGRLAYSARQHAAALERFRRAQGLAPNDVEAATMVAQTLIAMGKPTEARKSLEQIMKVAPGAPQILFLQGWIDESLDNLTAAETFFNDSLKKNPTYLDPYLHLSRIYLKQKKDTAALSVLEAAESKIGSTAQVRSAQGEFYASLGKHELAQAKFEAALQIDPSFNDSIFNLALALAQQNKTEEAKARFLSLKAKDPSYPGLPLQLGTLYLSLKEHEKAAAEFDLALAGEAPPVETRLLAIRSFLLAGQLDKALQQSTPLLDANPNLAELRALRAEVRYHQGKFDEALFEIQTAVERERKAPYLVLLGKIQEARTKTPEALEAYNEALKLEPTLSEIRLRRGIMLVKGGTVKDGLADLQKVIKERPALAEAYLFLGDALADLGKEKPALQAYLSAIARDAKLGAAHLKIGQIYYDTRRFAPALTHLQHAVQNAQPTDRWLVDAHFLLGQAAFETKSRKLAIDAYTAYLKLAPAQAAGRAEAKKKLAALGVTGKL